MSQIRDKKGRKKGIETKNPINAKSVQLIELHAFACDLVCIYLSESFDFLKSKSPSGNPSLQFQSPPHVRTGQSGSEKTGLPLL